MDAFDNIDPLPNFKKERTEQRQKKNKFSGKDKYGWLSKANHGQASHIRSQEKNKTLTHLNHKNKKADHKEILKTLTKIDASEENTYSKHQFEQEEIYSDSLYKLTNQLPFQSELISLSACAPDVSDSIRSEESDADNKIQLALELEQAAFTAELANLEASFKEALSDEDVEEDWADVEQLEIWQHTKQILKKLETTGVILEDLKNKLSMLKVEVTQLKESREIFEQVRDKINTEQLKINAFTCQLTHAIEKLNHQYDLIDLKFSNLTEKFSWLAIERDDAYEEDITWSEPEDNFEQALADYRKLKPELMGHYIPPKDEPESQSEMEPEDPAHTLKSQRTIDFNKKAQSRERDQAKLLRHKGLNYAFDRFKDKKTQAVSVAKLEDKSADNTETEATKPEKSTSSKTGMTHGFNLHRRSATASSSLKNKSGLNSNKAKEVSTHTLNQFDRHEGYKENKERREIRPLECRWYPQQ